MQYYKCGIIVALYNGMIRFFGIYVMFLIISPNIWLPFEASIPHCSETVMSALTVTPRSFSFTFVPNMVLPINCSLFTCPCLRREDSLVVLPAFEYYPRGAKQRCHLTDTG